jgi:hypothetical protein
MTIQQHIVQVTEDVATDFFRYAAAVPEEKLDWRPLGEGQSVLSMRREIAMTPKWAVDVMEQVRQTDEERQAFFDEMQSWTTVAQCQAMFQDRFVVWAAYVRELPDAKLGETHWLPYNGGRDHTYLEMLEYPRWNCTYHLGQIAYVQTLYRDKGMH